MEPQLPITPQEALIADAVGFLRIALSRLEQAGATDSAELVLQALESSERAFRTAWAVAMRATGRPISEMSARLYLGDY